ncbi:dihydropyrimidinase [Clostridium subterminale]|uniref:Dihydropyrimidinase n=1 Tax=Clostridium subterminale TaxID=1550 RepID=A0ABN1KYT3_CLOSU
MNCYDLAIINGNIYVEGEFIRGNLYINNGIIKNISKDIFLAKDIYDAKENYVLPGFIDPHVHFQLKVGSDVSADDFYNGSIVAAYGGVTTFIDFLDPVKNIEELERAYVDRKRKAKISVIDYGFHSTIANFQDNEELFIEEIKKRGICSIKFFTTYSSSNRKTDLRTINNLLKISKKHRIMLISHSENEEFIREGKFPVSVHEENRPTLCETTEVLTLAEMTRNMDGYMYIVHLSSGESLRRIMDLYKSLVDKNLFIESCPQYFYLSKDNYSLEDGFLYTLTPPLRSLKEIDELRKNIENVSVIGTDHCPFKSYEKERETLDLIPMGIGGIEHSFNLLYTMFGEKIIDKFTKNPAKIHGLYPKKGTLLPGSDADVVIFDPLASHKIKNSHSNCDYNLYEGIDVQGKVITTISRGKFIIKDEELVCIEKGNYVGRELKL